VLNRAAVLLGPPDEPTPVAKRTNPRRMRRTVWVQPQGRGLGSQNADRLSGVGKIESK
jgi:hypothetical protein